MCIFLNKRLYIQPAMYREQFKKKYILLCSSIVITICFYEFHVIPSSKYISDKSSSIWINRSHRLAQKLKCKNIPLEVQRLQYGSYWLIENFVLGSLSRNIGCADSITYAANGDYTFFSTLETVVVRWHAPVSFAVYAPGYDFNGTMESIQFVRNCLPASNLIQQFVTFHVFFPREHMPEYIPLSEEEAFSWPYDCNSTPYDEKKDRKLYRKVHNMTYPINVGRNIARKAANTYFIFTCDIELFPSPGLVDQFLGMIERNISLAVGAPLGSQRVFPLPVFELEKNSVLPDTKKQLKAMLAKKQAIRFHQKICAKCHWMPFEREWLNFTSVEMSVLGAVKRHKPYWEPFYISDNKEPMFDERVTWEGQSNKRIQGLAMCLLEYDYYMLSDGFLVHSPGIKVFDKKSPRLKYVPAMNKLIRDTIRKEYWKLYGKNKHCYV